MTFDSQPYDVLIVGYGPVGEVLATMLGRQGRRVAIIERWTERYPLPRAVCVDHEMYRMFSQLGMQDELPSITHAAEIYRWFNAQWKELISIDWSVESISGGPQVHFIHQPTLEDMLDSHVRSYDNVQVHLGYEVTTVSQTADLASVEVRNTTSGTCQTVSARYIVGCDGANSFVRQAIGDGLRDDRGFEADWLVIDILPNEGVELDIPGVAQWCNPERPTTIVPGGVREGRYYRRWEFMRLPHETVGEIETEEKAWQLLAPWVKPDQAAMIRHKVYTFRSLIAKRWRAGRLLIAGDAAHLMPPFMGQGMCSGLRDDWNLAWKLDMVLEGRADARLLDSYQEERYPHLSDMIDLSVYLGRVICQPDPALAAARDQAFLTGTAEPMPAFPHLTRGILDHGVEDGPDSVVGLLSPHSHLRRGGVEGRMDDLTGGGFVLITSLQEGAEGLSAEAKQVVAALKVKIVALSDMVKGTDHYEDINGQILSFMAKYGVSVLLVRPDYYIYGGGNEIEDANRLLTSLVKSLYLIKTTL